MRREKRLVGIVLAILMLTGTLAACGQPETVDIHDPADVDFITPEGIIAELAWEMIPLTEFPAVSTTLMPTAPGILLKKNQKAEIDYSNIADGYVMIKFLQNTTKSLKVRVTGPSGVNYNYNLKGNGEYEVFPLSDGNGSYTIGVFEHIEANRYATANSVTTDVKLKDEFAPFLRPNQYVNFNEKSAVVAKAAELVGGKTEFTEKIAAVYNFIIGNITYDRDFAAAVTRGEHNGYVPDVDAVLANKKGICFDYSAVMTAMLRSQGIPTRLVIGYAGTAYHAWIDVYSEKEGWINAAIFFNGTDWKLMDPTFASGASSARQTEEILKYIGDGSNYSARYLY